MYKQQDVRPCVSRVLSYRTASKQTIATGNTDPDHSGHVVLATRRERDRNYDYERSIKERFVVAPRDERRPIAIESIGDYFLLSPSSEERTACTPQRSRKNMYICRSVCLWSKKTSDFARRTAHARDFIPGARYCRRTRLSTVVIEDLCVYRCDSTEIFAEKIKHGRLKL